ncbi:MAG: hypothetical protein HY597_04960 [Candidatus Omnitrophica bacterium]|nr:hypothetical protein [Candidatus Omnitrophota bacterium]
MSVIGCACWLVWGAGLGLAADDVATTLTDAITQSSPTSRYSSGLGIAAQQIFGPAPSTETSSAAYDTLTPGSYYYSEEAVSETSKSSSRTDRATPGTRRDTPKSRPQPSRYDELQP